MQLDYLLFCYGCKLLVLHLLALVLLRVLHVVDELDVLVGSGQLTSQSPNLFPQIRDEFAARVVVDGGFVGDEAGLGGVGEGREVFLKEEVMRVDACDHEAVGVASDGLLEDRSQLGISVRHV